MRKALDHSVNIYDLSYIITAQSQNMVLVTCNNGMYTNAKDVFKIEVMKTEKFLQVYTKKNKINSSI